MRHPLEKSLRDGTVIILENDASGTYDVARWSTETGKWVKMVSQPRSRRRIGIKCLAINISCEGTQK